MRNLPIIRLELESMKHAIVTALSEHAAKIDADIKEGVERFCQPDNLKAIINQQVNAVLDSVIKEEIRNFYTFGEGRKAIKEAVQKRLAENRTDLDY